jgi:hypothetical protein
LELADSNKTAVTFRSFSLNLNVVIRAFLINNPDAPPGANRKLHESSEIHGGSKAELNIEPADLAAFRVVTTNRSRFVITAAAYRRSRVPQ